MVLNKTSIILAAALFLSLSANFFMAGLMLGNAVSGTPPVQVTDAAQNPDDARRAEWQQREEALRAALSGPDRDIVSAATQAHRVTFDEMKGQLDAARQSVMAAMSVEPFDQQALDAAIQAETELKGNLLREMYSARRAVMEKLSPEGREILQKMSPLRRRSGKEGYGPDMSDTDYRGRERMERAHDRDGRPGMRADRAERLERRGDSRPMRPPPGSPRAEDRRPPAPQEQDVPPVPPAVEP
jgi:hypothetical protein